MTEFTLSLVVPANSLTAERFIPEIAFRRLDFPEFGFPTIAIFISGFSISLAGKSLIKNRIFSFNNFMFLLPRAEIGSTSPIPCL